MFADNLECVGIATGFHDAYDTMTVITFAKGFTSNTVMEITFRDQPGD